MKDLIPTEQPGDDPHDADGAPRASGGSNRKRPRARSDRVDIPSREECVRKLAQIPGLVACKLIGPAQANSIINSLREILRTHDHAAQSPSGQLSDEALLQLLRDQPELLAMLEPLLTSAQVNMLLGDVGEDDDDAEADA